jgi:hypothetical protein
MPELIALATILVLPAVLVLGLLVGLGLIIAALAEADDAYGRAVGP